MLAYSRHDPQEEARQAQLLLEHRVYAILCLPVDGSAAWLRQTTGDGVPLVVVDERASGISVDCVVSEDYEGAVRAVRHLLQLGHRQIVHLRGDPGRTTAQAREAGYRAALKMVDVAVNEELIVGESFVVEHAAATLEAFLDKHLTLTPTGKRGPRLPFTAIFAANDYMAAAALGVLRRHRVLVPQEVAVVGFGDVKFASFLDLTTVRQPAGEMGRRAAERLFARLDGDGSPPEAIVVPTHLIVRGTCGAARAETAPAQN